MDEAARASLPTVLVLASGQGRRFAESGGVGNKLQADLAGKTVLQRTLAAVQASGLHWHLEDAGHPGMGDSIAAAVRATRGAAGWLILPGDLPLLAPSTLLQLAQASPQATVLVPVFAGQRGHPVRFGAACGEALLRLQGSAGAASVVAQYPAVHWNVQDAGCVTDIDTLADLQRVRTFLHTQTHK
ncbi:MAG: nucleotidyltransferase family protein [Rhodoferax sp.]|nr:nucleotidyltransferase family protein [Rhodoferax sp.]